MPSDEIPQWVGKPIIKRFLIKQANGYKDIEFSTEEGVQILVAENGAGKTTLLNALHAVLTGNHSALIAVEFSEFHLEVGDGSWTRSRDEFAIPFQDYEALSALPFWTRYDLPRPSRLEVDEIIAALSEGEEYSLNKTRYFSREYIQRSYPTNYIKSNLAESVDKDLVARFKNKREAFSAFSSEVSAALGDYSVLYLPTYRRIETSFSEYQVRSPAQRSRRLHKSSWAADQLIHFGLQDVESKLFDMAEEIRRSTVRAFSQINARTLDDLLFGHYKQNVEGTNPIDATSLQVVLGRLGRDNDETKKRIENLIATGEINNEDNIYLKSFLDQLMQTYASTQEKEAAIEGFIQAVNSYWNEDDSEKSFVFDKTSAEARVVNSYTESSLPLEALSSGEKQIVSVFARLYLEPDQKVIVLIDEPELSLSMEWQQKFLPDIVRSPSCSQLIAITHSPFIFQNELRPYAGSIKVHRHRTVANA